MIGAFYVGVFSLGAFKNLLSLLVKPTFHMHITGDEIKINKSVKKLS